MKKKCHKCGKIEKGHFQWLATNEGDRELIWCCDNCYEDLYLK